MDEYLSESEQLDMLRRWWRENGRWIIGGLVVGVAVLLGWRAWNNNQTEQAEAASKIYGELLSAMEAGDREQAASLRRNLTQEFAGTPYADQSGLALARLQINAGNPEAAAEALQDVLAATDDEELAHIARLRLARVHLHQDRPEAAAEALTGVEEGSFAPLYADIRGDIFAAEGDLAAARTVYRQALEAGEAGVIDRNFVQMKLDALGGAEAVAAGDAEPAPAIDTPGDSGPPAAGEAQPAPVTDAKPAPAVDPEPDAEPAQAVDPEPATDAEAAQAVGPEPATDAEPAQAVDPEPAADAKPAQAVDPEPAADEPRP